MSTRYLGRIAGFGAAAIVAVSSRPAPAETASKAASEVDRASKYEFSWVPAPGLRSQDGDFEISLHGCLLADGGYLDDRDQFYRSDGTTELRQARLGLQGRAWKDITYKFETDFADDGVDIKDAFIEYHGKVIDPAHVRVGQYKTPNSLEEETSLRFTTFMERAALIEAFDLDRRPASGPASPPAAGVSTSAYSGTMPKTGTLAKASRRPAGPITRSSTPSAPARCFTSGPRYAFATSTTMSTTGAVSPAAVLPIHQQA